MAWTQTAPCSMSFAIKTAEAERAAGTWEALAERLPSS